MFVLDVDSLGVKRFGVEAFGREQFIADCSYIFLLLIDMCWFESLTKQSKLTMLVHPILI